MILVTGGSGMIGQALVEHLLSQGRQLRVQVRNRSAFLSKIKNCHGSIEIQEVDFIRASQRDFNSLLAGCTQVVHTAGLVHQPLAQYQEYDVLNVRTTQQLAQAAAEVKVDTFLFLSTIAVYGSGILHNVNELAASSPVTPYAVSKAVSERWLEQFSGFADTIVLRPALVYGEGDRGNMIKLIQQIRSGRYFHIGSNRAQKSLIYCRDLARAIELCLQTKGKGFQVFNVANSEPVSVTTLADEIAGCLSNKNKIPRLPEPLVRLAAITAQRFLKQRSPLTLEQVEKLTSSSTCCVDSLKSATGFVAQYSLTQSLQAEISWADSVGLL